MIQVIEINKYALCSFWTQIPVLVDKELNASHDKAIWHCLFRCSWARAI